MWLCIPERPCIIRERSRARFLVCARRGRIDVTMLFAWPERQETMEQHQQEAGQNENAYDSNRFIAHDAVPLCLMRTSVIAGARPVRIKG